VVDDLVEKIYKIYKISRSRRTLPPHTAQRKIYKIYKISRSRRTLPPPTAQRENLQDLQDFAQQEKRVARGHGTPCPYSTVHNKP